MGHLRGSANRQGEIQGRLTEKEKPSGKIVSGEEIWKRRYWSGQVQDLEVNGSVKRELGPCERDRA